MASSDLNNKLSHIPDNVKSQKNAKRGPNSQSVNIFSSANQPEKKDKKVAAQRRQRIRDKKTVQLKNQLSKYYKNTGPSSLNSNSGVVSIFSLIILFNNLPNRFTKDFVPLHIENPRETKISPCDLIYFL